MGAHMEVHVCKICAASQTVTLLDKIQVGSVIAKRRALHQKHEAETLIHCTQWPRAAAGIAQPAAQPSPTRTAVWAWGSPDELRYHRGDGNWKRREEGYVKMCLQEGRLPV